MNKLATTVCLALASPFLGAQTHQTDTLPTVGLQAVEIIAARATQTTPVAHTNLSGEQVQRQNTGVDIPYLLSFTPSVLTTSDAGAGIGYTAIRIRGTDASRINVTTNGIPMNDAESNSLYWVNTPDLASSLQSIQVQRGVGTSTNGAGAFGGSIHLQTEGIPARAGADFAGSYGSFNTHKETVKASTGLVGGRWGVDVRLSNIHSDGYRDRAFSNLKSYFVQAGYYGARGSLKFITFGGNEQTYHAWDGIDKQMLQTDRTYNPNGVINDDQGNAVGFYQNQIDRYRQTHYQLLWNHRPADGWLLNAALHYTDGAGYYEEYKNARTLVEYGLDPFVTADGTEVDKSNLVRRKYVSSGFGGAIFSLNYQTRRLSATLGGGANYYENVHHGTVIWVKHYTGNLEPDHPYYRNKGRKADGNLYVKATYEPVDNLSLYADVQMRHLRYRIGGTGDQWDWRTATPQQLNTDETFTFFNPKGGVYWKLGKLHALYASVGIAHKEPTRNNYTDNLLETHPRAERMTDYELGYTFRTKRFHAAVNAYLMDYTDQLILTGALNEIGEPVTANVRNSYRMGLELTAGVQLCTPLRWEVNATWSRNRIQAMGGRSIPIAFSPAIMGNSLVVFDLKGWHASLQSQYVGRQQLNNEADNPFRLDAWLVNNLSAAYTFRLKGIRSITLGATVYNLFNAMYESNGYASDGYAAYYPNAGINALGHLTLSF
ncbi:MAG: TonB-dependent receptor [Prevotellaceae bacterium]|jgi:iron complex outermembrane receptor protein|nr:TonB-dependent receptor [Prevotellaceae bacterium]